MLMSYVLALSFQAILAAGTMVIARLVVDASMPHGWEEAYQVALESCQVALESCGANEHMTSIFKWRHEGSRRSRRNYEWCFLMAGSKRRQVGFLRKTKLLVST